jgi:predicted glycoside hydrolase/deacetylase ChbG (UPF0249 family)
MNNKVIITADDFGVCDKIDLAIIEAIENGRLTAVSVIVTKANWRRNMPKLKALWKDGKEFGIGLHFCITAGKPRAKDPNSPLIYPGDSSGNFREIFNYNFKASERKDVLKELMAQFKELESEIPRDKIDHLTNHHNVVYADMEYYQAFLEGANRYNVPIRTPMSWYRKFKKFQEVPDYEGGDLLNPTMRRGIKIGMWRKLGQMSYGNLLKRMRDADNKGVRYADVLCEYIYGQCIPNDPEDVTQGEKVLSHALYQFIDPGFRETKNEDPKNRVDVTVDNRGIQYANEFTVKKARRFRKSERMGDLIAKYAGKRYEKNFSMELIFHLAKADVDIRKEEEDMHGINKEYFEMRAAEFKVLSKFELPTFVTELQLELIPFKKL